MGLLDEVEVAPGVFLSKYVREDSGTTEKKESTTASTSTNAESKTVVSATNNDNDASLKIHETSAGKNASESMNTTDKSFEEALRDALRDNDAAEDENCAPTIGVESLTPTPGRRPEATRCRATPTAERVLTYSEIRALERSMAELEAILAEDPTDTVVRDALEENRRIAAAYVARVRAFAT